MTKQEFKKAITLAMNLEVQVPAYLSVEMSQAIGGCALDNKRRYVTLEQVAGLIRGHCATHGGTWDMSELPQIEQWSKRFDLV